MGALAAFFGNVVTSVLTYLGLQTAKRAIIMTAAVGGLVGMFGVLAAGIKLLLVGITYTLPAWAAPGAMFLPSNLAIALSALITAKFAVFLFRIKYRLVSVLITP